MPHWDLRDRFLELRSRWFTLIGEHLLDDRGTELEYWRIEKDDSAIILPIYHESLVLPPPSYRPGIGQATWDFPGGRVAPGQDPQTVAAAILCRELGIEQTAIAHLKSLNPQGWAVNSSFSNQKLYGFVAEIHASVDLTTIAPGATFPLTETGIQALQQQLVCLQCRAVLMEWWQR